MKIFQIYHGRDGYYCHLDVTPTHPTLESTRGKYTPDIEFAEAPDYVFENWGFDRTKTGDARFIQPIPPDGWDYDLKTGSFIKRDPVYQTPELTETQKLQLAVAELGVAAAQSKTDMQLAIAELAATMTGGE